MVEITILWVERIAYFNEASPVVGVLHLDLSDGRRIYAPSSAKEYSVGDIYSGPGLEEGEGIPVRPIGRGQYGDIGDWSAMKHLGIFPTISSEFKSAAHAAMEEYRPGMSEEWTPPDEFNQTRN